jgi:ribosome biogenesis GTPase
MRDKVSVLAGPSGVGKSSLMNILFPGLSLETGEISKKIERGKHTTRHTEFLPLCGGGGYIADTPGFTSLDVGEIPAKDFQYYFKEFNPFLGKCRFADCAHISEPDCAVKEQIGKAITESRYRSYVNFYRNID